VCVVYHNVLQVICCITHRFPSCYSISFCPNPFLFGFLAYRSTRSVLISSVPSGVGVGSGCLVVGGCIRIVLRVGLRICKKTMTDDGWRNWRALKSPTITRIGTLIVASALLSMLAVVRLPGGIVVYGGRAILLAVVLAVRLVPRVLRSSIARRAAGKHKALH